MYLTNAQNNTIRHYFSIYEPGKNFDRLNTEVIAEADFGTCTIFGVEYFIGNFLVRFENNKVYRFDCECRKGELGGKIYDVKGKKIRVERK